MEKGCHIDIFCFNATSFLNFKSFWMMKFKYHHCFKLLDPNFPPPGYFVKIPGCKLTLLSSWSYTFWHQNQLIDWLEPKKVKIMTSFTTLEAYIYQNIPLSVIKLDHVEFQNLNFIFKQKLESFNAYLFLFCAYFET